MIRRYLCWKTQRQAPIRNCPCIKCAEMRAYRRQWFRDQRELKTPFWLRRKARRKGDSSRLHTLTAWRAQQPHLALLLYDQLRHLAQKDGLWHPSNQKNREPQVPEPPPASTGPPKPTPS